MLLSLAFILLGHWVADFVLQTRWMARNKSHDVWALVVHVTVYTHVLTAWVLMLGWWLAWRGSELSFLPRDAIAFGLISGMLHFATDYFTSRLSSRMYETSREHAFWTIGLDQWIHQASIIFVLAWVLMPVQS